MKYRMNIIDESGRVKTGYEYILEGEKNECLADYFEYITENFGFKSPIVVADLIEA